MDRVANQSKITIRKNPSGEPLFQPNMLPYVERGRKSLEADLKYTSDCTPCSCDPGCLPSRGRPFKFWSLVPSATQQAESRAQ